MTISGFRSALSIEGATRWMLVSSILAVTTIALYGEELATSAVPTHSVVWGSLALAAYLACLLCMLGARKGALLGLAKWNLGSWMLLWYGLTLGLATVTWSRPQPSPQNEIAVNSVLRALGLVAVAMTFWALGYCVGPGHPLRRLATQGLAALSKKRTMAVRNQLTPWIIYTIGAIARASSALTTGRFGYVGNAALTYSTATSYQQILTELAYFCPLAVCAAALQVYRERIPGARITLIALFFVEFAFSAVAGSKQDFAFLVLALAIPMSAAYYRLPKAVVIGGVLAFLVVVIPFNQEYRGTVESGAASLSKTQAIEEAPAVLRQAVTSQGVFGTIDSSVVYLLQRVQEIDGPAIILQRTPGQIAFSSPVQLVETPLAYMVPRALWPGKPISQSGYQFSQQYYEIPSTVVTSSAISPIGDIYRHGGWIPIIVCMFIFGCGIRLLDDVLDIRDNPHAILLIILVFPSMVIGEIDWVGLVSAIPETVFTWVLATYLMFRPRSPG